MFENFLETDVSNIEFGFYAFKNRNYDMVISVHNTKEVAYNWI